MKEKSHGSALDVISPASDKLGGGGHADATFASQKCVLFPFDNLELALKACAFKIIYAFLFSS